MHASEVYPVLEDVLSPPCTAHGFTKNRRPAACWHRAQHDGYVVLWLHVAKTTVWDPVTGGVLHFRALFCPTPQPDWQACDWHYHLLQTFLDPAGVEAMAAVRDRVLDKLLARPPEDGDDGEWHAFQLDSLRARRQAVIRPHQDWGLPYHDAEDVRAWAEFIAGVMPVIAAKTEPWPAGAHVDTWGPQQARDA